MAFCDLSDLFGKFRKKKKTRFTDLETTAKELLGKFVRGEIGNKEFADAFNNVGKRLNELMNNGNEIVIDKDTPLWLSSLLGLHFIDRLKYQRVEQYFQEHPEELVGEHAVTFERLKQRKYTDKFRAVCANVLSELDK